jgi:hypothetical protein
MWLLRFWQVLFTVGGLFLVGLAVRNMFRGSASRRWPQAPGRILRSVVLVEKDPDGSEGFMPQVEYEYVVGRTTYRGMRLRYGQIGSASRRRAKRVIARYQAGASVSVFVDPRNPGNAVLIPGRDWGNLAIALAGAAFLACAYLISYRPL